MRMTRLGKSCAAAPGQGPLREEGRPREQAEREASRQGGHDFSRDLMAQDMGRELGTGVSSGF